MATKIRLIPNLNYKRSGTKSYVHLMRKYRFNPTKEGPYFFAPSLHQVGRVYHDKPIGGRAHVQQTLKKRQLGTEQVGEVSAEDVQNDSEYLAQVSIGTPAQTVSLDFDTGSADLWVWSTKLPSATISEYGKSHNVFDPSKSSTFKELDGYSWQISYGDGSSASGSVGTDNVDIGGITVKNQAVELAEKMSTEFAQGAGDGLLGLAFGSINTVQPKAVKTPVENMIAQDDIPDSSALFTANLGSWKDADDADKGESFYTFGFIDDATVQSSGQEISYTPIDNSQGFWMFNSTSATVNGKTITRSGNTAIADTGTTLALVDDDTCKAIYDAIPGAYYDSETQGYIYPSDTTEENLPVVSFAVGDKQFVVQKEDLGFAEAKTGYVYGGIQSRGDMTFDILGDTFLKSIYAIFDVGNLRFGAVQREELQQNLSLPSESS
ncbi:pepsin-like aspartic protease [Aspergillus saccharolyticus JOP 1030-1]|uniref:Acid protease n=1 Tax=Aspergillus saccharolyticus JOP 1030-1 TaxID=1450539 RepID=A0A318ZPA3_9EURO|nr:acid protease [Aspergillus saccharolyticus JOP 1030-1]PYH45740.1 acid protease [Aspergillus saccharolyticus JOP 1030-1]